MEKFVVLIDMDDTIENLLPAWLKYLNAKYRRNVQPKDVTSWHIHDFYPDVDYDYIYEPLHNKDFWYTVSVKEDAVEYMRKLYDEEFQLYICTHSCIDTLATKIEAILTRYFPYIDDKHVIVTYNKQMLSADVLIDDGPHNLINGNYAKLLYYSPHNESFDAENNGMIRVYNWEEVYDNIHNLYKTKYDL